MRWLFLYVGLWLNWPGVGLGNEIEWENLPALPSEAAVGGGFAGIDGGSLLLAGGANFPAGVPWQGGQKVWQSAVWVWPQRGEAWQLAGHLPWERAYGVSIQLDEGILLIGGSDATRHYADCWRLRWQRGKLELEPFPSLPVPLAEMAGARVGDTVYLVGGIRNVGAAKAESAAYRLDLQRLDQGWQAIEALPALGRLLAVAGACDEYFYVFSGAALKHKPGGTEVVRDYLTDAWKYHPEGAWQRLEDMPRAAVAAASPAPLLGRSHLLVIGGDDGQWAGTEASEHPGFTGELLAFDVQSGRWSVRGKLPEGVISPVTTPAIAVSGAWIVPSGEARPAVRTAQVIQGRLAPVAGKFGWLNWGVLVVYLAGMVGISYYFMKRDAASTTEAYFRGDQGVPGWVAGLSVFATMLSALTFMGIPARVYQTDSSWYIGQLTILLVVPVVMKYYLPFFRKLDLTSVYEYLEQRFNLACRWFAAMSFSLFHVGRVAVVLYLPALALAAVSDIEVELAIGVIGILCIIYTVMGGIKAVVWTDAVQAIVLLGGALLCLGVAVWRVDGGVLGMLQVAEREGKGLSNLEWGSLSVQEGTQSVVILLIAFFFNSLVPYTSSQDVVQRYMTTADLAAAKRSLKVTMWASVFGSLVFFILGAAIYVYYFNHPADLDMSLVGVDSILPFYVLQQLPVGVSGLVIAAIFAASQSTISSSLNSVATVFVKDIDQRIWRPGREDETYLRSARWVVCVVGALGVLAAWWMASASVESAFKAFNTLVGLTVGSLGGLFALGVFTRRANGLGGFIGAMVAMLSLVGMVLFAVPVTGLLYATLGFVICFGLGYVLSMLLSFFK